MRSYFVPAITVAMIMPGILSARSDDIPTLDVRPVCRGIASQSELEAGLQRTNFEQCVQSEQAVREQLKKEWPNFSAADKQHCVSLARTGGESSYTELITCMEMARDVRALRSAETASSTASTSQIRSSPSAPSVPSVPANTASQPASEPTNKDVESTLKELQRLKADAQNARKDAQDARTSEVLTQRKLADAEADLKRAKEEAGRATTEAEQAKAQAKDARDAKAVTERKLADAEAARSAAEERLEASESAAKNQQGFGPWLRGWFGRKPSNQ
jgi:hypothetical protein